jgi:tocopherol O-methyltransferase
LIIPRSGIADLAAVAAHYDDLDELYRGMWGLNIHHGYWITGSESSEEAVLNLTRLVAEQGLICPGDLVCDIGCGYGAAALTLNREYGAQVTGLTVSEKQYQRAKASAQGIDQVKFFLSDALSNNLAANSFDVAIAIESSEHMPDKLAFLREANRLLRGGGRCVVTTWLAREGPTAWESRHLLEPICAEGRLPNMASATEFQGMLESAGFEEIRYFDLSRSVKKTWSLCARRVAGRFFTDPTFRRILADPDFTNRVFAKTVFRIWLAYQTGSMCYGCFSARK